MSVVLSPVLVPGRKRVQSSEGCPTGDPLTTELTFPVHSGHSCEFTFTVLCTLVCFCGVIQVLSILL